MYCVTLYYWIEFKNNDDKILFILHASTSEITWNMLMLQFEYKT